MKKLALLTLTFILSFKTQAAWVDEEDYVHNMMTSWHEDSYCVQLENGSQVKLDLSTENGRADLTIALTALTLNKKIRVRFSDDQPAVGGCDTGQTVRPYGFIRIIK